MIIPKLLTTQRSCAKWLNYYLLSTMYLGVKTLQLFCVFPLRSKRNGVVGVWQIGRSNYSSASIPMILLRIA